MTTSTLPTTNNQVSAFDPTITHGELHLQYLIKGYVEGDRPFDALSLADLKTLAQHLEVAPQGDKRFKKTWAASLRDHRYGRENLGFNLDNDFSQITAVTSVLNSKKKGMRIQLTIGSGRSAREITIKADTELQTYLAAAVAGTLASGYNEEMPEQLTDFDFSNAAYRLIAFLYVRSIDQRKYSNKGHFVRAFNLVSKGLDLAQIEVAPKVTETAPVTTYPEIISFRGIRWNTKGLNKKNN